jgi:hypothetical protein
MFFDRNKRRAANNGALATKSTDSRSPFRRWAALPLAIVASGCMLIASACGGDDTTGTVTGSGGSQGTGGTIGTGGAHDASIGGGGSTGGGTGTGGTLGTGGAGTGGARQDAAPDALVEASMEASLAPCNTDAGDASGDCCPDDPNKTLPGQCGCGVPDSDSDNDGVADCIDACPTDPLKTLPGVCGCNAADADTDHDGVLDCLDGCPFDGTRTTPGPCGCGVPDNTPLCLVHRYSFNDRPAADAGAADAGRADAAVGDGGDAGEASVIVGTTVVADSIGHADGIAVGVGLTGTGSVTLAGGTSNQHIMLPAGIISALGNSATFEVWVTWSGVGGVWQRIFDFGNSDQGPGNQGIGQSWLFLSPLGGGGVILTSLVTPVGGVNESPGVNVLLPGTMQHLAVVVDTVAGDASASSLSLYLNGALQTKGILTDQLSTLRDVNNWLGKSQFVADPEFGGTYHEFRIYSSARSSAQILAGFTAGPDTLPAQ